MWQDPGLWIALGISALFIVVGVVMHRVFVRVLKGAPTVQRDKGSADSQRGAH
jgi:hypothetical protein